MTKASQCYLAYLMKNALIAFTLICFTNATQYIVIQEVQCYIKSVVHLFHCYHHLSMQWAVNLSTITNKFKGVTTANNSLKKNNTTYIHWAKQPKSMWVIPDDFQ